MSSKRAKLNLDFGHNGVSMNFAMANDIQPRDGIEDDWSAGTHNFNTEEFDDFPGNPQSRLDENRIRNVVAAIRKNISEWQRDSGYDFDPIMEITISASFFDVIFFPYNFEFSKIKDITDTDMKAIEECKHSDKMFHAPIPGDKIKSLTSPYYTIYNEKNTIVRLLEPIGKKTKKLGFNAYFITKHPMLSMLLDIMKDDADEMNVSLSCEKEFRALVNKREKDGKTLLIHITDFVTEFSAWEKGELKYLNKKETGFRELKEAFWRLCLCYRKNPKLTEQDFELLQNPEYMQRFYNMVKSAEISDDSKELLSSDDCTDLLEFVSCVLAEEIEHSIILEGKLKDPSKHRRFELPGKNKSKTGLTVSSYVLNYFARETIRNLLLEIKRTLYSDDFCKPEFVILECPLPLKGIEKLTNEVFEIPVRKAQVKWAGEIRGDLSSSCIGALQSLIAGEGKDITERKKTSKISSLIKFFSRVS